MTLRARPPHLARHAVDLFLELVHFRFELVLFLRDLTSLVVRAACRVRLRQRHRLLRELAVLARDLIGLLLRRLHVAFTAGALFLLETALRLAQLPERRAGLPGAARISRRCRAPHGVGGLPRGLSGLREIGTIAFARQAFELSRRFFRLLGECALARAAALAALPGERLLPLALGFLLLPAGQLAQLFHQRVDLLIGLLLLGALRGFVLVRELVEILLEELGEIFLTPIRRHRRRHHRRRAAG